MDAVIKKWGNSLGVRIPNTIVKELGLKDGSPVDIDDDNGTIVISIKHYDLQDLVSRISETNVHKEISTGPAEGREAW